MKWLLVLLVILAGVWWLRQTGRGGRSRAASRASASSTPSSPQDMTQCQHCGLHLPLEEAVPGQQGHYCSTSHRQQHEG
jgi:uncharacterized protein